MSCNLQPPPQKKNSNTVLQHILPQAMANLLLFRRLSLEDYTPNPGSSLHKRQTTYDAQIQYGYGNDTLWFRQGHGFYTKSMVSDMIQYVTMFILKYLGIIAYDQQIMHKRTHIAHPAISEKTNSLTHSPKTSLARYWYFILSIRTLRLEFRMRF